MSTHRTYAALLIVTIMVNSCATTGTYRQRNRLLIGMGTGAAVGGVGGNLMSPNDESRGLNTLVFGLAGALIGGLISILTDKEPEAKPEDKSLKAKEFSSERREYVTPAEGALPDFVKQRLQPAVVEEYTESDSVEEDGALHAPHKVYRILRPAELFALPKAAPSGFPERSKE